MLHAPAEFVTMHGASGTPRAAVVASPACLVSKSRLFSAARSSLPYQKERPSELCSNGRRTGKASASHLLKVSLPS